MKKDVILQYNEEGIELILQNGDEKKIISMSYKEAKKLNCELKKALDYDKEMNIVTCSVCSGKKQIKSNEEHKTTIVCRACGGKGYTHKGRI